MPAFNSTTPNLNYAVNRLNQILDNVVFGEGIISPFPSVEAAVQWAIKKADGKSITYSTLNRNLKNPNGLSYDCSSFVITAFYVGGIDVNATTTADMKRGFVEKGFMWIPGSYWPASKLRRGDILLHEQLHTQLYIGNNQDANCGATPANVITHSPDNFGRSWNGILRAR